MVALQAIVNTNPRCAFNIQKGDIFVLQDIMPGPCKHFSELLYIGHNHTFSGAPVVMCNKCRATMQMPNNRIYFVANLFAPLDEDFADNILEGILTGVEQEELVEV